jgi:O-antigen ligase
MNFIFKNKFNFYFILLFFHTLGATWIPFSSTFRIFAFLIAFIYVIFKINKYNFLFLFFILLFIVNFILSINHFNSIRSLIILIPVLYCEYYFSKSLNTYSRLISISSVLRLFTLASLFFYYLGDNRVIDNVYGVDGYYFGNQFSGIFESVNYFYFYFFIFISTNIILYKTYKYWSLLNIILIFLLSAIIILNFPSINRTFLLAFTFFLMTIFDNKIFKYFFYLTFFILIVFFFSNLEFEYLESFGFKTKDFIEYGIFGNRSDLWLGVLNIIKSNYYYLHGSGYGNEVESIKSLRLLDFDNLHAHNTYFSILLEFGVIPSLIILFIIFSKIYKVLKQHKHLISLFISFFIFSFFDSVFKGGFNPGHFLFFTLFVFNGISKYKLIDEKA